MSLLHESIQFTTRIPQVPPDQNDQTLETRTYTLATTITLLLITIIIAMNTILAIYCLHKTKARKVAKDVDREFGIIATACMYVDSLGNVYFQEAKAVLIACIHKYLHAHA